MTDPVLLSAHGSDRATAYNFSNKILRHEQGLLVSWLDAPLERNGPTRIQLGVCDAVTGTLRDTICLGEGIDNHCGLSMLAAPDGRVHAFIGAHHGDFLHRWSDEPADPASWSEPEAHGPSHSYPAVVLDEAGTLHLVYRESYRGEGETWQLEYVRKPADGGWSQPVILAKSPVPGYNHFMHSLSIGPTGALHLTFQFHYAATGSARQGKSKLACHLRSEDGGDTWRTEGEPARLPVTIENARPFVSCLHDEAASIRIGTHVVDETDEPWLFCALPEPPHAVMYRHTSSGWQTIDLQAACPDLDFTDGGRSTATTRAPDGAVHMLISTADRGAGSGWYHPANELHHLTFATDGVATATRLTPSNAERARWLPSIEHFNWGTRESSCAGGHWYTWTDGVNAGWMDAADYEDTLATRVMLSRLPG